MIIKPNSKQNVVKNERDQLLSDATDQVKKNASSIIEQRQTVKESKKMQEENNVVEEVKNEEQVNGDPKIVSESPFKTMEEKLVLDKLQEENSNDPNLGFKILGGVRLVKGKKSLTGKTRKDSIAEYAREFITDNYPEQSEFVTHELTEDLKKKYGLKNTDVSGQLYGLKKSGWIENREPTEAEMEIMGKGVKIWKGTDKLYDAYADDLKVAESTEDYEVNKEDE